MTSFSICPPPSNQPTSTTTILSNHWGDKKPKKWTTKPSGLVVQVPEDLAIDPCHRALGLTPTTAAAIAKEFETAILTTVTATATQLIVMMIARNKGDRDIALIIITMVRAAATADAKSFLRYPRRRVCFRTMRDSFPSMIFRG